MTDDLTEGSLAHIEEYMNDTERYETTFDGHKYWFEYRTNLQWETKLNILLNNTTENVDDTGNISEEQLDVSAFYIDLLREQIVDSNIDKINIFLTKMPDQIGDELAEEVADTVGVFDDEGEEGN